MELPLSASAPGGSPAPRSSTELQRAADSLAARLQELADAGSARERVALRALLARAMTPIERMRYLDLPGVLSEDERRLLGSLTDPQVTR